MPEKVMPGPIDGERRIREAVSVHTKKIMDACRDKDCVEDLRVWPTKSSRQALSQAVSVKAGQAELLYVTADVEPISFNRGFYTVDVRYFYRITADAFVGSRRPAELEGLAVFDKRVILFGSEGSSKTFYSDGQGSLSGVNQPTAVIEAVDPLVLSLKLVEDREVGYAADRELAEVPKAVFAAFESELDFSCDGPRLYATLGQFSLVRLERDTQLLIPSYDYCIPEKECTGESDVVVEDDPCELFRQVQFPVDEFFPPDQNCD